MTLNKLIRIRFADWSNAIEVAEALAKDGFGVSTNVLKSGHGATLKARRIKGTLERSENLEKNEHD